MSYPDNKRINVAAIQMVSGPELSENLKVAAHWIAQAAFSKSKIISLPEYFCFLGNTDAQKQVLSEPFGDGPIQHFLSTQAALHGIYLVGGTLALRSTETSRFFNSTLVYGPNGECIARYDKIHLFSFQRGAEQYDEAQTIQAGPLAPTVVDIEGFKVGLGICYDLRFPELFRAMGPIDLLVLPAAFTYTTGQAHWELLLRARAVENQCYVLAPAQGGTHQNGRRTWGHTQLIDPWGVVINDLDTGEGVVSGIIEKKRLDEVRSDLPALVHRRFV